MRKCLFSVQALGAKSVKRLGSIVLSLGAVFGFSSAAFGAPTIEDRVTAVRAELSNKQSSPTAVLDQSISNDPELITAQWLNWGNWGNWSNWTNWGNWGNWLNWFNG